jgi:hypothetical protein
MDNLNFPQFPLYIVSKGRADSRLTSKSLEEMKVPYFIVIEEQEYSKYAAVIDKKKILVLDKVYQDKYDTFDDLGSSKSKGPGAARNFAWDHSMSNRHKWHWVMDDNINRFYRLHQNMKIPVNTPSIFRAMEDFCLRYENIGMAGPHYCMFAPRKNKIRPFMINTRIYSCNLIRNDIPFRWRGRYNEDTDLSLNILKAGMCTVQFYAFLQMKMPTQVIKGGNTADFYSKEGTLPKSTMLYRMHPDVTKVVHKFGRWHHIVDYSKFKYNKLIKTKDFVENKVNNYGMVLKHL